MQLKRQVEYLPGSFVPESLDVKARTVDVVWSKGSRVRRWAEGIGAYLEEISIDPEHLRLERFESGAPLLNTHRSWSLSDQIGVVERVWIADKTGFATIKLSDRDDVEPIFKDICSGIIRNISFGYKSYKAIKIEEADELPVLRSIDTEPYEISLVPVGADPAAQIRRTDKTYTQEIITRGDEMTDAAASGDEIIAGGDAEAQKNLPPKASSDHGDALVFKDAKVAQILSKERERVQAIEERCQKHKISPELSRSMIQSGVGLEEVNSKILDELVARSETSQILSEGRMPRVESGGFDERQTRRDALKNGLLMGYSPELVPDEQMNESVRSYARKTIPQMIAGELERRGERVSQLSSNELVSRSFHSTSDFPIILGMAGDATIKNSYQNLIKEQTFRPLVRYEVARDFMPMRKVQMGEIPHFERIPEGAEVKFGTISENAEQWAIYKHGQAFSATFEMMVNDQKNLIFAAMTAYAAAAANAESNLVWGVFKSNPMVSTLDASGHSRPTNRWFSKEHRNEAPASALDHDSLEESEYMMSVQKGNDEREGDELNIVPRFLIVPSRLKNTAKRLIYSQYHPTKVQDVNLYQNQFDVISEARLNPKQGEAYPWYLACDPKILPVVWMAYLDGQRAPETTYHSDFDTLSVKIRADLRFGVTHGEWRAVHRNAGVGLDEQRAANKFIVPIGSDA